VFTCQTSHYFSQEGQDRFQPRSFLQYIKPFSRIAIEEIPFLSSEEMIIRDNRLSSVGKALFLDKHLFHYLKQQGLVDTNERGVTYRFIRPWDAEKLSRLGISYVMQKGKDSALSEKGWKLLAYEEPWALYKNPINTSLAYLVNGSGKYVALSLDQIRLTGNSLEIQLPDIMQSSILFATFNSLPGWKAFIDGQDVPLIKELGPFLQVPVQKGQRIVQFVFQPFPGWFFVLCASLGLFFPLLFFQLTKN